MRFQNKDLVDARNQLGQLAQAVTAQLNGQQALGLDLTEKAGGPLLSMAAPRVLPASNNTGGATVGVTINNASQVRASDYELTRDSAGAYSLRRLSDNHSFGPPELPALTPALLASGVQVDGLTIQVTGAAQPAVGDRFLLQPVAVAGRDLKLALDDPRGIAAASPISASVSLDNKGTVGIDGLKVLTPIAAPATAVQFRFAVDATTQATTYTYSTDGGAPSRPRPCRSVPTRPSPGRWARPRRMEPGSARHAGRRRRAARSGPPRCPPATTAMPTRMLGLRDVRMVGAEVNNQTGAVAFDASSFSDAYANILSTFGVRVQTAKSLASNSAVVAEQAKSLASNTSGVNLDEEAARLIQFQQSYQAAAKMLQVAQSVFDTLLSTAGGR